MRFDPEYVSQVLNENFEDAKTLFLGPLMAIHYAHLVMLADRGIISADDCARAARGARLRLARRHPPHALRRHRAKTSSSTSSGCSSTRAARDTPAACTRRAAATTST